MRKRWVASDIQHAICNHKNMMVGWYATNADASSRLLLLPLLDACTDASEAHATAAVVSAASEQP
jgi:hypothetical protein